MPLYHEKVYMPRHARESKRYALTYSAHALAEASSDMHGTITLPDTLDTTEAVLIEAEVINVGHVRVLKRVYRLPHDDSNDIVLVVQPDGLVRTVWLNRKNDRHATLDRSRYSTTRP